MGGGVSTGRAVAAQSDGRILVAGSFHHGSPDFALSRYTAAGALDTTFNGTGQVTTRKAGTVQGMAVQTDGRIVLAGYANNGHDEDFSLARYTPDPVNPDKDEDGLPDAWELAHFGNTAGQSALDDTDHDGRVELLELAFRGDPRVPDAAALPAAVLEDGYLTVTISKQTGAGYLVETSGAPGGGFSATSTMVLAETASLLKVRDTVPRGTESARYLRVKVTATLP